MADIHDAWPLGETKPAADAPHMLSIQVLGRFELRLDGKPVELGRKARALLSYLVLSESCAETRERLTDLLWSDSEPERARASLRQCLREIRIALAEAAFDGIQADRESIALDRNRLEVDLWQVLQEARGGRPPARLLDGPGLIQDMLVDLEAVDRQFGSWLIAKRQTWTDRFQRPLQAALRSAVQEEDARFQVAQALLCLDATDEEAVRCQIRILIARGDITGAQRIYRKLTDLLDAEYGTPPDKQTTDLIKDIKAAVATRADATGVAALPASQPMAQPGALSRDVLFPQHIDMPARQALVPMLSRPALARAAKLVLAVAPFEVAAVDSTNNHFVQGFRRQVIASLVRFREWIVREGSSAAMSGAYGKLGQGVEEYALEGHGVQVGGDVHVTLTLREIATNDFLWSESLSLTLENLVDAQRVVVRRIATALNVHLSASRMASIAPRPIENLRAYDIWLLGQATILNFDPRRWDKAAEMFRQVIAEMPGFAPAHSSLAQLINAKHIARTGVFRDPEHAREALTHAREAARLDPIDSRSQLCLGWSHALLKQYEQSVTHMSLAYELNDNDPWTLMSSANCMAFCGLHDRATEIAQHVLNLPLEPTPLQWAYQTAIRFMAGDYQGCLEASNTAGDTNGNVPGYKSAALYLLGRPQEAHSEFSRFKTMLRSRWIGSEPATDANIARWFLYMFPIAKCEDWQRLHDGLKGAGAYTEGLHHHGW